MTGMSSLRESRCLLRGLLHTAVKMLAVLFCLLVLESPAWAQEEVTEAVRQNRDFLSVREMLAAGGTIGYVIMFLSFLMVALIVDACINLRKSNFMPPGLAEEIHQLLSAQKIQEAQAVCQKHPGYLSRVLKAGLEEVPVGNYAAVEKAMEDAAVEQAARCSRRIEYLSVISTLAPMLGLMGTVWGMIVAFMEFELKANPQISELAPGIYKALVTTLQGLGVAIPAIGALAVFRSRVEDLTSEATLLAGHVFSDFRRGLLHRTRAAGRSPEKGP